MVHPFNLTLLCMAVALFLIAAFAPPPDPWPYRGKLIAAGLACWAISNLVTVLH